MADAQLNSMHLEAPRRQAFREAREGLLGVCHGQTLASEVQPADAGQFALADGDRHYPLKVGINTIGRMPDNDIVLEDAFVSRRHCAIVVHVADGCEVHDVASKNGTFVNGQKLAGPARLRSGDAIRLCDRDLIFVDRSGPQRNEGDFVTQRE